MTNYKIDKILADTLVNLNKLYGKFRGCGPILANVSVTTEDGEVVTVDVCGACYQVVFETWEHADWCEHFEEEPLNKFLKEGLKNGNTRTERNEKYPGYGTKD